jgi:hypothetical protein
MHTKLKQNNLLWFVIIATCLIFLVPQQSIAAPTICYYWVFKPPYQNPIVPGPNFLGYWFPPQNNPGQGFTADGGTHGFIVDAKHPNGPFFAPEHDGIDLFAWLDSDCKIHLFKTTDVVKPTTGGIINDDGFKKGPPDGVAHIIHPPKPVTDDYESYGHVDFRVNGGDDVNTNTVLGTLSNLGKDTFVHLHYSIYAEGVAKDPLSFMERRQTTCIPAPAALTLAMEGLGGLALLRRRRGGRRAK